MTHTADDHLPRCERIDDRDLKEICESCNGRGIVPSEKIILRKICLKCNGNGSRYWVDKIMDKKERPEYSKAQQVAMDNIQFLMGQIRMEAEHVGVYADVKVDFIDEDRYRYNSYPIHHPHSNPLRLHTDEMNEILKRHGGKF
jgi:hypothetical protein